MRHLILGEHTVVTTAYQGWSGYKNGALLKAAEAAGFALFVSSDQELRYQQNLGGRRIAIIVLTTNDWTLIKRNAAAISALAPAGYTEVEIPE